MTIRSLRFAICLALSSLVVPLFVRAEVSQHQGRTLIAAITDGSDPFGNTVWDPLRPLPPAAFLNAGGGPRGDGPPHVVWDAVGTPYVVWSYNRGLHHDIAFSSWAGEAWTPIEFLETSEANALDPRLHVGDDGTLYVAWWTEQRQRIFTTTRTAGLARWSLPQVQTVLGKRPSLAVHDGVLRVAFEVSVGGMDLNAIAVIRAGGIPEVFVPDLRSGRLDPLIHSLCGKLWIDYKATDDELGVLVLDAPDPGTEGDADGWLSDTPWRAAEPEPWTDPSWVGVEFSRRAVQLRLLEIVAEDEND